MNDTIELSKHEVKCIDETVLVHDLDNNTVVQLNGTAGKMFLEMCRELAEKTFSVSTVVASMISTYPDMRGRETVIANDFISLCKDLKQMGLLRECLKNEEGEWY